MAKVTGNVKWFNDKKGYGFISQQDGPDVFVHFREINMSGRKTLLEGQSVSFEVTDGEKGLQAQNVTPLDTDEGVYDNDAYSSQN